MAKALSLVVLDGKKVLESVVLAQSPDFVKRIIPRRQPDKAKGGEAAWIIAKELRRAFGKQVDRVLSEVGDRHVEKLYGWFGLVGIGKRWVDNTDVRWCLYLGERQISPGMNL